MTRSIMSDNMLWRLGIILPLIICFAWITLRYVIFLLYKRNYRKEQIVKKIGMCFTQILVSAFCGVVLLTCAYSLPIRNIDNHVRASAYTIQKEGTYYRLSNRFTSQLDNFTDSIMLLASANRPMSSSVNDAMNIPRGRIEEHNPAESLVAHYIDGTEYDEFIEYPRYWHGYLIFLKPLLEIVDYKTIRIINAAIQLSVVLLTSILLYKRSQKTAIIPYLLSYCMLMPPALAKSIQFSSCFYVFSLGCISLLMIKDENLSTKGGIVFLYCGILTAFFDLLTYPVTTFGVPMAFYLLLTGSDSALLKIHSFFRNGVLWCVGYVGMWSSKWFIASVITGENVVTNGLEAVGRRSSLVSPDGSVEYSVLSCEIKNFQSFLRTPITILVLLFIGYLGLRCLIYSIKKKQTFQNSFSAVIPFMLTSLLPVCWYAFATNHSMVHFWFTNKACVVTILSIMFGLVCLLQSSASQPEHENIDV